MGDSWRDKIKTAEAALAPIQSGQHVVVGSGAAEPQHLVEALSVRGAALADTEVLHLLTLGIAPYAASKFEGALRHNALFIGPNVRDAVLKGLADYTPCLLSEIPSLFRTGRLPVDVALIQVAPPEDGMCSLGIAVDIVKAAVECADYVVAQVNPRMPWTHGDSLVPVASIDAFVEFEEPLLELPPAETTAEALWIGRYVAHLVEDGATLQMGIGSIPDAVLAALGDKKDLGIHSEMISDGVLALLKKGALNGRRKTLHPGKIVASFCMGSRELYAAVDRDPRFEFYPSDYVNDPFVIAQNERMVAINSALQIDLTGQVAADSLGHRFYSGVGGQVDFIRGAARSQGGRSIIALPSSAKSGMISRITADLHEGTGVVTTRADVDFVVTEYGIASLKGKNIRERAVALIQIAHPKFRRGLIEDAKRLGYLDMGHVFPEAAAPYMVELETKARFGDLDVFFRPLKPSDERRLKDLFYSQSAETTYMRYGIPLKRLSERQFQELVAIDYWNSMAVGAFVKEGRRERLVAVGRYYADPGATFAEAAFTVHDTYQGKGIGSFMANYLTWIARERGLEGFIAEVISLKPQMRHILKKYFRKIDEVDLGPDGISIRMRFADWLGTGNPAEARQAAHAGKR